MWLSRTDKACGPFAGKPAPTGTAQALKAMRSLWERVLP
ncbi:hypothetical protein RK21_00462 [Pseudomonas plecoglossicida]|nr:hypothetical protein RK21_00462 [Pseudomonas plecoglossicida]